MIWPRVGPTPTSRPSQPPRCRRGVRTRAPAQGRAPLTRATPPRRPLRAPAQDVPPNNERALAAAVQKVPVSIAIDASQPAFQHYIKGILHGDACGTKLDHGVLIVGCVTAPPGPLAWEGSY